MAETSTKRQLNLPLSLLGDSAPIRNSQSHQSPVPERILIVDDDPVQRRLLETMLVRAGYESVLAEGGEAAAARLIEDADRIDAVVLDLVMPGIDGLTLLKQMRETGLSTPVIVQTAHGGLDNVVAAMRAGAADFVVKPVGAERLIVSLRNALAASALAGEINRIKRSRSGTLTFRDIITRSPRMHAILRVAEKAAGSTIPVLIEGQSGVGKELIARAIHGSGARRAKPFVAVNCGAIPDNLVESILFGHEKGAFTGATERHLGKFVEASGGTLFLDEVGELPPAAQVKLLRAIQEGEVEPVGARKGVKIDVRLISATNRDLAADLAGGRFREDLFYRLHVFPILVPELADRPEDIPELARHFLARFAAEEGKRALRLDREALALLMTHPWPGNVRQLENAVFRAVVLAESDEIGPNEFPQIAMSARRIADAPALVETDFEDAAAEASAPLLVASPATAEAPTEHRAAPDLTGALPLLDAEGQLRPLEEVERDVVRFALAHYRGRISEVARRLRIGRSTLYRKLETFGLGLPQPGSDESENVIGG
jgi:DNA-binding NtrC family response regulator